MRDLCRSSRLESRPFLIARCELGSYDAFVRKTPLPDLFQKISDYQEFLGDSVASADGRVLGFEGGVSRFIFPLERVDEAVAALLALAREGARWLQRRGMPGGLRLCAHAGEAVCGPLGTREEKRVDCLGTVVQDLEGMTSNGLTLSPQVFRRLSPATRRLFKKHTPPIRYIPLTERHED